VTKFIHAIINQMNPMDRYKSLEDIYLDLNLEGPLVLLEREIPIFHLNGNSEGYAKANINKEFAAIIGVIDEPQIIDMTYALEDTVFIESKKYYESSTDEHFWVLSNTPVIVPANFQWSVYIKGLPKTKSTVRLLGYYSFNSFHTQKLPQRGKIIGKIWKNNLACTNNKHSKHEFTNIGVIILSFSIWIYHDNKIMFT
jgi:hypothetical protein